MASQVASTGSNVASTGSNVALTGLARDLALRAEAGRPVTVGLVGAGEMGTDIVTRIAGMPGMRLGAVIARSFDSAQKAIEVGYGAARDARPARTADEAQAAVEAGAIPISDNPALAYQNGLVDVVLDATGSPVAGAEIGLEAMRHGKHLVMMNVEADVTIGSYLAQEADRLGVVYTIGAGDEPSACMELIELVTAMGHKVVAAGKGKNNPLNIDATPDAYVEEATRRNMNPRMLVEFVDGSKTMVEMAALANATGLTPDKPGMHGPVAGIEDLPRVLIPTKDGGLLSEAGRVDFTVGPGVAPGVFVIIEAENPRVHERMSDLKMGDGPYFALIRPFHMTSLEAPLSCARAVLYGKSDMRPLRRPMAEVCAVAKRDLAPGERFDRIGEYMYRSWIMRADEAAAAGAVPCGMLAEGAVTAPIKKGDLITYANAAPPAGSKLSELRALQDAMLAGD